MTTIPTDILALLAATFPSTAIGTFVAAVGGFSHHTLLGDLGGRAVVVKAAEAPLRRGDVRRETAMLRLLADSGLPVAPLLALAENDHWTVAVMGALPGVNGLALLAEGAPDPAPVYQQLGALLAAIHRLNLPPLPGTLLADRARQVRAALPDLALAPDVERTLVAALDHPAWYASPLCLVHGDAGIHNLLWHSGSAALIDWEWAGWGPPLLDLAWVRWTIRWRRLPDHIWGAVLAGYGLLPTSISDHGALSAIVLGQMAGILVRVQHQIPARAEWLRRIDWTMALSAK